MATERTIKKHISKTILAQMGQPCTVDQKYERRVEQSKDKTAAIWYESRDIRPRQGWFVGVRYLNEGQLHPGEGGMYTAIGEYDDYTPPTMRVSRRVRCYLVQFWPTENPVYVPCSAARIGDTTGVLHPNAGYGEGEDRDSALLRAANQDLYRDSKGRFRKGPK
jgi:hypothetical protein